MEPKSDSRSWSLILGKSLFAFSSAPAYIYQSKRNAKNNMMTYHVLSFFLQRVLLSNKKVNLLQKSFFLKKQVPRWYKNKKRKRKKKDVLYSCFEMLL